jgi:hypothetical protein
MTTVEQRELERVRYWQGQLLRSKDFRVQMNTDAQLRAWHNRALHSAYGIALGYEISPLPDTGPLTGIRIQPGVAYDCFGRAITLVAEQVVLIPPAPADGSGSMTLLLRYPETSQFPKPGETAGVCLTCCAVTSPESPEFVWKPSDQVTATDGVPAARVSYDRGQPLFDAVFITPAARPIAKPYLANGETIPGGTVWTAWKEGSPGNQITLGLQTVVDTSEAGFTRTPCYFAWLQGLEKDLAGLRQASVLFTSLADPAPDHFTFRILVPLEAAPVAEVRTFAASARRIPILAYVCWLGGESRGDLSLCLEPVLQKPCCV